MKDDFATDLKKALDANHMTASDLARELDVTPNAISKYIRGEGMPRPGKWAAIKRILGVDPKEYIDYSPSQSVADSTLTATNGASISISIGAPPEQGKGVQSFLTETEAEVLTLFRRYGNMAMLEKCLAQLRKQQEMFG